MPSGVPHPEARAAPALIQSSDRVRNKMNRIFMTFLLLFGFPGNPIGWYGEPTQEPPGTTSFGFHSEVSACATACLSSLTMIFCLLFRDDFFGPSPPLEDQRRGGVQHVLLAAGEHGQPLPNR